MSQDDLRYLARNIRPLLRSGDVAFGEVNGETVAMAVCLPNINEAIADFGGRMLPLNWLKLIWRLKIAGLKSARVPLMGVVRKHQVSPLGTDLMLGVIDRIRTWHHAHGTRFAELSWVLEDNRPMRRLAERVSAVPHKTLPDLPQGLRLAHRSRISRLLLSVEKEEVPGGSRPIRRPRRPFVSSVRVPQRQSGGKSCRSARWCVRRTNCSAGCRGCWAYPAAMPG